MAGGIWNAKLRKLRAGTYINHISNKNRNKNKSDRGVVVMPLVLDYGAKEDFTEITLDKLENLQELLGYGIDDDVKVVNLINRVLENGNKLFIYNLSNGQKATKNVGNLTATAKFEGKKGNDLSFAVISNPTGGFDVQVNLSGKIVEIFKNLSTIEELIAKNSKFIDFTGTGDLQAVAGSQLENGTTSTPTNESYTQFLSKLNFNFNILAFQEELSLELKKAVLEKLKSLRYGAGKLVQGIVREYSADSELINNVCNGVTVNGIDKTDEAIAYLAGLFSSAKATNNFTNTLIPFATGIKNEKTEEEIIQSIKQGEIIFTFNNDNKVIIEADINSLVTTTEEKNKEFKKNEVIRALDDLDRELYKNFPPNKFANIEEDWDVIEGLGKTILKNMEEGRVFKNIDYDNDFLVNRALSKGDELFINIGVQPILSVEKIYITVKVN